MAIKLGHGGVANTFQGRDFSGKTPAVGGTRRNYLTLLGVSLMGLLPWR